MTEDLNHYLQAWNLSDPQPIAQTPTSHVYTVTSGGVTTVLKLLTLLGVKDEKPGAVALRHYDGHGAVRLLRHDDQAHLLEYAEGDDLTGMVKNGGDEQATVIIAGVLNKLHHRQPNTPPQGLRPLKRWFRALFIKARADRRAGQETIYMRGARIAEALLADQRDLRVLHGDIHHENIRHNAQRGWLAFDPKGLYGERTYDAANTLCNPDMPELVTNEGRLLTTVEILARETGMDHSRLVAFLFAYACLSVCWAQEDDINADWVDTTLRIAEIAEPHVRLP
jgi:streptomycin 6-kinase